ncbi:transglycosylase domain-containing protein [Sphingomonas sp. MMS24-JH45]
MAAASGQVDRARARRLDRPADRGDRLARGRPRCSAIAQAADAALDRADRQPGPADRAARGDDRRAGRRREAARARPRGVSGDRGPALFWHWGIDPRGIARAAWANVGSGGVRQGGSTITQQLAKNAFLDSDRTAARKLREVFIAFWLEAWLTKDEILSRYLSNVYFGDNVYGLTAASKHYFGRSPDRMNVGQAADVGGAGEGALAPRPHREPEGRARAAGCGGRRDGRRGLPVEGRGRRGPAAARVAGGGEERADRHLFRRLGAARSTRAGGRDGARQGVCAPRSTARCRRRRSGSCDRRAFARRRPAIVAMKTSGEVVAMVGGRDYRASPFNRATQARRQPGSTFKLFVYLAAMRAGMDPSSTVDNSPVEIAGWKPKNDDGRYLGEISLARAFARSSNVAAARLTQQVGVRNVVRAARDLGISTPIANEATIGLGTSEVAPPGADRRLRRDRQRQLSRPAARLAAPKDKAWYQSLTGGQTRMPDAVRTNMLSLLNSSIRGTGREANLPMMAYGRPAPRNRGAMHGSSASRAISWSACGSATTTTAPIRASTAAAFRRRCGASSWRARSTSAIPSPSRS